VENNISNDNNNTVMYTLMAVTLDIAIKLVPATSPSASHCMRNIMNIFLYHTRGTNGIVKVNDAGYLTSAHTPSYGDASGTHSKAHTSIFQVETLSRTFCATSSCSGDCKLMVTPSKDECIATLYYIRRSMGLGDQAVAHAILSQVRVFCLLHLSMV
jgi:hypothetical protein